MKNNIYIQNFWYINNYGACLTAYALWTVLKNLGYNPKLVDISNYQEKLAYNFNDFVKKYLDTTNQIKSYSDLESINEKNAIYITGSDQVFRPELSPRNTDYLLLNYVNPNAKKISMSGSFGYDKDAFIKRTSKNDIENIKTALKSFDFISTREKSGVEICKNVLNVEAEWIIDPVFILDKSYYENLSKNSNKNYSNKIVSYMFTKRNQELDNFLKKKYGFEVYELFNSNSTIEDWLKAIKDCKFLVTNSFHATCFAIIFNKPFIALSKDMGAASRFDSILEMLDIKNQCIDSCDTIYEKDCIFKVDYEKVNQRIEEERKKGLDFLKTALEAPVKVTQEKLEARMKFLENKVCELEQQTTLKYQIKKELWNLWLVIFHRYLPLPVKNIIRFVRGKNASRK